VKACWWIINHNETSFSDLRLISFPKMRKRRTSDADEGSEMEIEDEEKIEQNDPSSEENNEDEEMSGDEDADEPQARSGGPTPFLDAFYGLSASDARERADAAQVVLHHCLLGPDANAKDASYAFRRLLNGLCSGRAAARQGNASALASFLKAAFASEKMAEIRREGNGDATNEVSLLAFVRLRLIATTDPSQTTGKKKGSEERDYQFGRLFGILAVVRSDILLPTEDGDQDLTEIMQVTADLINDLSDLFWLKRWMREPAAHGIATLLDSFYNGSQTKRCMKVVKHLVEQIVIPRILQVDGNGGKSKLKHSPLVETYCAEQIAIAAHIQSHIQFHPSGLPFPLDRPVVSTESLPLIGQSLSETSSVVQPRTHFVWDAIWSFLTENENSPDAKPSKTRETANKLRQQCPVGDDNAVDVVDAIIREVLVKRLLRIEKDGGGSSAKTTHERRSLALCIVKILCGVTYQSATSGPSRIKLDADILENVVLTRDLIRTLFLDVICAGNQRKQSPHLLKPLALEVLRSLTDAAIQSDSDGNRQLACVRAFLNCEIRFDARTKTSTVSDLLHFHDSAASASKEQLRLWNEYISYLEQQFVAKSAAIADNQSTSEATGYVELLYSAAKSIMRLDTTNEDGGSALSEFKQSAIVRIQAFLMAAAFFKSSGVSVKTGKKNKKSKKGGNDTHPILKAARKLNESEENIPYPVRIIVSSRFFSLLSDHVNYATHHLDDGDKDGKQVKDSRMLEILNDVYESWNIIESAGAERYLPATDGNHDESEPHAEAAKMIAEFQKRLKDFTVTLEKRPGDSLLECQKRCATGISVLAYTLYLHMLSCGTPEGMTDNDDPDQEDEDDVEEIKSAVEELKNIMAGFLEGPNDEDNPLLGLAESCANILSSPIGSGSLSRGASPKLVREAVKFAWLGGLSVAAEMSSEDQTLLDGDVVNILLEAIGASGDEPMEEDGSDGEEGSGDEDNGESSEDEDEGVFGKASEILDNPEEMEIEEAEDQEEGAEPDSDVELDSNNLQAMLEEDSDADVDVGELEHHEGADAALAQLIKMKQEARKAGQQVREKLEISHQLRCSLLIEVLIARPEAWKHLLRSNVILKMLVPMLKHRRDIEKSLKKAMEKGTQTGIGEKKALLERLTSLLKSKFCKMRLASIPCSESIDIAEYGTYLVAQLIEIMKKECTKEHAACCNGGLILVLRAIPNAEGQLAAAGSAYEEAVKVWSTKRTTRVEAGLFDELIAHMPR
jgi:hypothetical protein